MKKNIKKTKKIIKKTSSKAPQWNLGLLYSSRQDPAIMKDVEILEKKYAAFAAKYDIADKVYTRDAKSLLEALTDYEKLAEDSDSKPIMYFYFLKDIEGTSELGTIATSQLALLGNRLTKAANALTFFLITLGTISAEFQKKFLADPQLARFKVLLSRIFADARYSLTTSEEKVLNLKNMPSREMWIMATERLLSTITVTWKGKKMPLSEAHYSVSSLSSPRERKALEALVNEAQKGIASAAEAEMNAVVTDKKIEDELRGYKTPYEATVLGYRNDPKVIDNLITTVTKHNHVAHSFYKLKAKLLKLKKLSYSDRAAKIGTVKRGFDFAQSTEILKKTFGAIDKKYADYLDSYIANGQIDVAPRVGKQGGAYCAGFYKLPTFVLLNHVGNLYSLKTYGHEMGHAFHGELSRSQGPIYSQYSTALAETASTLFESLVMDSVFDSLSDAEKIVVLHDKINDDISTIFRQVACFNFEKDIHEAVRTKGFVTKEVIAELHNKNMKEYLGPVFDLDPSAGYAFVSWSHIRRFFYVYTYAYGMLVSKALLRRYRQDKSFWTSIEKFLSSGGKASPEEILAEIGIDMSSPEFFREGIAEIEADIEKLRKLTQKSPARKNIIKKR